MPIVDAPLHSQRASGALGTTLIYQPSRGQNVVRTYGKPNWALHPATAAQLAVQAFTKLIMEHWLNIPLLDQATWDPLAEPANISRVNAYCIENWRRHRGDEPLLDGWPDVYSTLVAGNIPYDSPYPAPNVSGDYLHIANYDGFPAYRHTPTGAYYVYRDEPGDYWCIDTVLGTPNGSALFVLSGADPEGEYAPGYGQGIAHFTLS